MKQKIGPYSDPYANLAAAIIASGRQHNDVTFLESDWCDNLREMCALDDEMHPSANNKTSLSLNNTTHKVSEGG